MKSTIFAVVAFAAIATAVPSVTPVPLTPANKFPTCTWWPGWIRTPDADVTGSLMFVVSDADDAAINDLTLQQFTIPFRLGTLDMLGVHLAKSKSVAKTYVRCINGNGVMYNPSQNITISKDINNANLAINPSTPGYTIEPYAHEINGVRQDGVYIGALNQTKWGFRYRIDEGCDGKKGAMYYEAKLLGLPRDPDTEPGASYPHEFEGFIKVITW